MKPTVEEQLQGTCRILETVVAPCVAEPFARTILDNLIANLRMMTAALPQVAGFLRYDNEATLRQLSALREALPPELLHASTRPWRQPSPTSTTDRRRRNVTGCCESCWPQLSAAQI